jgi:exonuclease SbcC
VILRGLRLFPFGCFTDSDIPFEPGLNVILGPNEAGKSTIFRAVRLALFVRTKLQKKTLAERVAPHLPVSGGDFIRAELTFEAGGSRWLLRRRWGFSPATELILPGGGALSDDDAVAAAIEKVLPAAPGTAANLLMTEQSSLAQTLDVLRDPKRGADSLSDLSDILRRTVLSTGGVSVDRFAARITEERSAAWSHWDAASHGPEAGRGVERPWKTNVGKVLAAWYGMEEGRAAWRGAVQHEASIDRVNAALRVAEAARAQNEAFVKANSAAARDARARREREAELRAARMEKESLARFSREWPAAADRARKLQDEAAADEPRRAATEKELAAAQKAEEARGLREKLERVQRRKTHLDEARRLLAAAPPMDRKSLDAIRAAASAVARLEAGAEAGAITVTIAGRAVTQIVVQEDLNPEVLRALAPGKTTRLKAAGRARIVHRDLEIEVRSGDAGAQARGEKAAAARAELAALLAKHGVSDADAAEERGRAFDSLSADARAAQENFAEELAGETLAALEVRAAALGPAVRTRPIAAVSGELATIRSQAEARARELGELSRRIAEWESQHGSQESLMMALAGVLQTEARLASGIDSAAPLPAGFADPASFLKAFDQAQADLAERTAELRGLDAQKSGLEQAAPTQSAEELGTQAKDAGEVFEAELRRAQALDRIHAASTRLLAASETAVHAGMTARLSETLASMTSGRHSAVVMEGPIPVGLTDAPGRAVTWDFLSAGTRDTLALALRLAMASYFLGDADGFLLMDDPLVDMDPARQSAAAAALIDFARKRQLILFTCHPGAADLLGGHRVVLEGGG